MGWARGGEHQVDLDLSEDQELLRETTSKFLTTHWPTSAVRALIADPAGVDRELWQRGAELGWTSMLVPEEHGGGTISGEGIKDLAIVAEELGRRLTPGPTLPTNLVAYAIARSGREELAKEHLPGIAAGEVVATWIPAASAVQMNHTASGVRLDGVAAVVQDAQVADLLLVSATGPSGPSHVLVPANEPGLVVEPLESLDLTRRYCRVRFEGVELPATAAIDDGEDNSLLALALALQCAETVGATDVVYGFTLQYVKDRKAFGRPIGSFQALKHRLAEMVFWLETAKAVTTAALAGVQAGIGGIEAARLAKAYVADRCPAIVRDCLQMHGGIGFTWEHDIHLYLRRIDTNSAIYGSVDQQLDALAPSIGL
jgi:alkylation response protein AidB-like acyl-CoA dehydrogenase